MTRPRREEYLGLTYHVYCRGVRRTSVFRNETDYWDFIWDLKRLSAEHGTRVLAYCLMPNHPHMCLRPEGDPLSQLMQRLNLRHAQRFNRGNQVTGHLNEARYRAQVVDTEQYLLNLVRYIHQNPVRAGLCATVGDWRFSSHRAYLSRSASWVRTEDVLGRTGGVEGYRLLMDEGLPSEELEQIRALGRKTSPKEGGTSPVLPSRCVRLPGPWFRRPPTEPIALVASRLAAALGVQLSVLALPDRGGRDRAVRQEFARRLRLQGYLLREIGIVLNRDEATVSRLAAPDALAQAPLPEHGANASLAPEIPPGGARPQVWPPNSTR